MSALQDRLVEVEAGLWTRLHEHTGATLSVKSRHPLHLAIAFVLDKAASLRAAARTVGVDLPLKAPDGRAYLADFVTTVGTDVSEPEGFAERPELAVARMLTRPHEAGHVLQHLAGVDAGWWPRVTTHSALYLAGVVAHTEAGEDYVAKVEGDMYAVTECVRSFLSGAPRPFDEALRPLLDSYNLLGVGPDMAAGILRSHYATMNAGLVPNVAVARLTIDYLTSHAADLKGRVPC